MFSVLFIGAVIAASLLLFEPPVGYALFATAIAAIGAVLFLLIRRAGRFAIGGHAPALGGVALSLDLVALLGDAQSRFLYARQKVDDIPTGIAWPEVAADVDVLLWEAVEHAARASVLDAELFELRYSEPGTPQARYRAEVQARRDEHEQVMRGVQREAEELASKAGNAAAAAHLALIRTGDLRLLEVAAPSGPALAARDALGRAKERLDLLTDVWTDLDPSGPIAIEQLLRDLEDRDS